MAKLTGGTILNNDEATENIVLRDNTGTDYTLGWNQPSAARALTIPDPGGNDSFTFNDATQTLTSKTVSGGTLSGTTTYTNAGAGSDPTLVSNSASQQLDLTGDLDISGALTLGTALAVAEGGTGSTTASSARTSLGLAIGSDVQAWDTDLDTIATGDPTPLDGDHLDVTFTPSNYTPDSSPAEASDADDLAAHLKGIDAAITSTTTAENIDSPDDSGAFNVMDMGVTSSPAAGTEESLAMHVDATEFIKLYAEADGTGGIQNARLDLSQNISLDSGTTEISSTEINLLDGMTGKTGSDASFVTGTAGTSGDLVTWNVDGDVVDGPTPPSGTIVGTTDTQTLTNKTVSGGTLDGTTTYTNAGAGSDPTLVSNDASQVLTLTGTLEGDGFDVVNAGSGSNPQLSSNNSSQVLDLTGSLVVSADLTVNGTTTTVNTSTLDVEDANITVNNGGNQASAEDTAGLTVEMSDATDGSFIYDSNAASFFRIGEAGSEIEIADISSTQSLTNKTLGSGSALSATLDVAGNTLNNTANITGKTNTAGTWQLSKVADATGGSDQAESQDLTFQGSGWNSGTTSAVSLTMTQRFKPTDNTTYATYFLDDAGSPVAKLDESGNLQITGTIEESASISLPA